MTDTSTTFKLSFDGQTLTLFSGETRYDYPALTGRLGSLASIPEGQYWIRRDRLWIHWFRPLYYRITLYASDIKDSGKSFIYGDLKVGSVASINLGLYLPDFVSDLKSLLSKADVRTVPLTVIYPQKDEGKKAPLVSKLPSYGPVEHLKLNRLIGSIPDVVLEQISTHATDYGITTNLRLAHFLAQCAHESGGFKKPRENLNYSAGRLKIVFPKYFVKRYSASKYAHSPQKLGSLVYGKRLGNGNEASGEGYKYRGRGYIHITGKSHYEAFAEFVHDPKVVSQPDLVATKYPLDSAVYFFQTNDLWSICDDGADEGTILAVSKVVNKYDKVGLPDRILRFKRYYKLLNS